MDSTSRRREIRLRGIGLSEGFAIGRARRVTTIDLDTLVSFRHEVPDADEEVERLHGAIARSREQIKRLGEHESPEIRDIFAAQIVMIDDASVVDEIAEKVREMKLNSECILAQRLVEIRDGFELQDNDVLRAKAFDIQDVFHRVLANLLDIDHVRSNPLKEAPPGTILVSERLLPSDVLHMNTANVAAIVTEAGSAVSHAAILARGLAIPYVAGIEGVSSLIRTEQVVLVEGSEGTVVVSPTAETIERFRGHQPKAGLRSREYRECRTLDGSRVHLLANASSPDDVRAALRRGAEGIGLYRTEFFYLQNTERPSEEQETDYYRTLFGLCAGKPRCLRLFDFGGDKVPVFGMPGAISRTPFGERGIRYLLHNKEVLKRQLTCIASASAGSPFDVLIPFVTAERELAEAVECLRSAFAHASIDKGVYRIGMMLEVPSAFFALSRLLPHVDFVSVGTNDLVQYTFAFDREEQSRPALAEEMRSTIIELIGEAVRMTRAQGKELTICGQLGAEPAAISSLLQAGVRSLSVRAGALDGIRSIVETTSLPST